MFSGIIRWFHKVEPEISLDVHNFFAALALDIEHAGGLALTATVQNAVNQLNTSGQSFNTGQLLQAGINAGKDYLGSQGIPDLDHALFGAAAAAVSNLHADSVGASVVVQAPPVLATVTIPPPEPVVVQPDPTLGHGIVTLVEKTAEELAAEAASKL